jgi:hypothetical protein
MGVAKVAETRGPVSAGGQLNRQKDSTHWARQHEDTYLGESNTHWVRLRIVKEKRDPKNDDG